MAKPQLAAEYYTQDEMVRIILWHILQGLEVFPKVSFSAGPLSGLGGWGGGGGIKA